MGLHCFLRTVCLKMVLNVVYYLVENSKLLKVGIVFNGLW